MVTLNHLASRALSLGINDSSTAIQIIRSLSPLINIWQDAKPNEAI
ncbi:DUF2254 family protein [Christiangramia echinicola]